MTNQTPEQIARSLVLKLKQLFPNATDDGVYEMTLDLQMGIEDAINAERNYSEELESRLASIHENEIARLKVEEELRAEVERLKRVNGVLAEALEWYANDDNWNDEGVAIKRIRLADTPDHPAEIVIEQVFGSKAQQALNLSKETK